jgi:hypothetical protein
MKTHDDIDQALDAMLNANYYGEDFEVTSSFRVLYDKLAPGEQVTAREVLGRRLVRHGTIVDVLLCGVVTVGGAGPILVEKLNQQTQTSQLTRMLIQALRRYPEDAAYRAVERFLDSDQDIDALQTLCAMDFTRSLPSLVRALRKPHVHGVVLQCLVDRRKATSLDQLIQDLTGSSSVRTPEFSADLQAAMLSKTEPYHPFPPEDIERILAAVRVGPEAG